MRLKLHKSWGIMGTHPMNEGDQVIVCSLKCLAFTLVLMASIRVGVCTTSTIAMSMPQAFAHDRITYPSHG
jgi:acyl-coenzyme A synthetase/AMP-(fatty) acid ligase